MVNYSLTWLQLQYNIYTLDFIFLYFRMGWKELLDHQFWTQVLKEEEYGEEEEKIKEGHEEEKNSCDGVDPAESRYVDILFHFFYSGHSILQTFWSSFFTA